MAGRLGQSVKPLGKEWNAATRARLYEYLKTAQDAFAGLEGIPGPPSVIHAGDVSDPGDSQVPAPSDHTHAIATGVPETKVGFGGAMLEGDSSKLLRSDARLVLEDGEFPGQVFVWDGTQWILQTQASALQQAIAVDNSNDILAELKTISDLLQRGLNVPDEVEDIRKTYIDDNDILAELKTIVYFLSAGLNERPNE